MTPTDEDLCGWLKGLPESVVTEVEQKARVVQLIRWLRESSLVYIAQTSIARGPLTDSDLRGLGDLAELVTYGDIDELALDEDLAVRVRVPVFEDQLRRHEEMLAVQVCRYLLEGRPLPKELGVPNLREAVEAWT